MKSSTSFRRSPSRTAMAWLVVGFPLAAAAQPPAAPSYHGPPACLPSTPPQFGNPRIPATLEPPGTVAPIVRPFENLSPLPAPPSEMAELPAVPVIATGRSDAIEEHIRQLRGRLSRSPAAAREIPQPPTASPPQPGEAPMSPQTSPPVKPADAGAGHAIPSGPSDTPPSPPPIPSEERDPLASPPPVPIGAAPQGQGFPAPQQSITAHKINGLDPDRTTLHPPAPPPVVDDQGTGLFPSRNAGPGTLASPPAPLLTEINSSSISALSIPVEILRSPIDHVALADNLYAAKSYGLALEAYQAAAKASVSPPARRWSSFQAANCYRLLGHPAEAERQYRRLAGDRDGGQFSDLSRWWLQSMDQKSQLSAQLEQLQGAMQSANAAAAAAADTDQETSRARPLTQP